METGFLKKALILGALTAVFVAIVVFLLIRDERISQRREIEKVLQARLLEEAAKQKEKEKEDLDNMTLDEARKSLPKVDKVDYDVNK